MRCALTMMLVLAVAGCSTRSAAIGMAVGSTMVVGGLLCGDCGREQPARTDGLTTGQMLAIYGAPVMLGSMIVGLVLDRGQTKPVQHPLDEPPAATVSNVSAASD